MASNLKKPSKKTAIIAAISVVALLAVAITGTVVFLKDRGTTEAADLETEQANRQENVATANNNQETPAEPNTENAGTDGLPAENGTVAGNADNTGANANTGANVGTTTTTGNAVAGANNGNATTTTDNIQETTITRNETVYTENPWETQDVTWRPMAVNAELASANVNAEQPDFVVTKVADKTIAQVGEKITYTITVTSKQELKGIEVKDVIPAGTKYEEADNDATLIKDGETVKGIIWKNVDLKKSGFLGGIFSDEYKAEFKLTVTVTEEAKEIGTISNVAVANGKETEEPTKTSIIETAKTSVITREDKEVEAPAKVGDKITYTITVENKGEVAGTATIKDADLKDILADGKAEMVGNVAIKGTETTASADELIKGIEANVPANGKVEVVFTVEVKKVDGQIKNVATIDDKPTPEVVIDTVDITAKKHTEQKTVKVGETISYTITLTNNGSKEGTITLKDSKPDGTEFVSATMDETEIKEASLANGINITVPAKGTKTITVVLKAVAKTKTGDNTTVIQNIAKITEDPENPEKPVPSEEVKVANITSVKESSYEGKAEGKKLKELDEITYTITATNTGKAEGTVKLSDKVPEGTTLAKDSIKLNGNGNYSESDLENGIEATVPADNGKAVLTFKVTVNPFTEATKTIKNAEAKQDTTPVNPTEDPAEKEYVNIAGTKTWIDPKGTEHKAITINLLQDTKVVDTRTLENGNTKYEFTKLNKYALNDGHEYTYEVEELPVDGYTSTKTKTDNGYNFTNTIAQKTDVKIEGTKTWVTPEKDASKLVAKFELYRDDVATGNVKTTNGNGTFKFENLEKYDLTDGHEYVYTVKEVEVDSNYTSTRQKDANGNETNNFTNTIIQKTDVKVEGTKTWITPETDTSKLVAKFELYRDNVATGNIKTINGNGTFKFENLEKYDLTDGHEYNYTVKEVEVDNNYTSTQAEGTNNFTNTIKQKTDVKVEGTKTWVTPETDISKLVAKFELYRDDVATGNIKTINGNGTFKFENLEKYDLKDGHEYKYTAKEVEVDSNYTSTKAEGTNNYTNIIKQKTDVKVEGSKTWITPETDASKLVAKFELYKDGVATGNIKTINGNGTFKFENLEKYDLTDGHEYNYTAKEVEVDSNYTSTRQKDVNGNDTNNFTNTIKQKTDVKVEGTKTWVTPEKDASKLVAKFELYRDDVATGNIKTINGNGTFKFENLEKYDLKDGHEYRYTVKEVEVDSNYTSTKAEGTNNYTNTIKQKTDVKVEGTKTWITPETDTSKLVAKFELYRDDVATGNVKTINGNGTFKFENLEKYDLTDGHEYKYIVKEIEVDSNYESIRQKDANGKDTNNFINTIKQIYDVSISGTKTWDDADNIDGKRPTEIKVNLMRKMKNGTQTKVAGQEEKTVTAENNWKYEFKDLVKYDTTTGEKIIYTVVENEVAGYTPTLSVDENDDTIINISNRREVNHLVVTKKIEGVKPAESETGKYVEVNPTQYSVTEGEFIKYKIEVANNGNTDLTEVVIKDDKKVTLEEIIVPSGMNKEQVELKEYAAQENLVGNLTGTLKKGEKITLYVVLKVEKDLIINVDTLTNNVIASARNTPEDSGSDTIGVAKIPGAKIEKTSILVNNAQITSETKLKKNDIVTYELKVTNTGNTILEHVNITDDRKVTYNGKVYNPGDKLLGAEGITLPATPGENTHTIRVSYQVTQGDLDEQNEQKTLINWAYVTVRNEDNTDTVYGQDDDSLNEIEANENITEKIKSIKVNGKDATTGTAVNIGDEITYTITVKNDGTAKAKNVTIEDYVPEGTKFVSTTKAPESVETRNDGREWRTWKVDVPVGEKASIAFTVKVTNEALGKTIENTAMVNKDDTNEITNNTQKAINIYEVESIGQGQKAVVVIDMSLSMASAVKPDINSDTMAYTYETTRWYYLKTALDEFINKFLANGKNEIAIVGFNSEARTLISEYTSDKTQAKGSYADVFTETHFNNLKAAARYGREIFNQQQDGSFKTDLSGSEGTYVIDVDALTYLGEGKWHKDARKNIDTAVRAGDKISGATETTPCRLGSGTNIASGLKAANDILGNGKTTNTSVILMTDGEDTKSTTISSEAKEIHGKKAADLYTIAFTNDAKSLTSKVGSGNITKEFSATDSDKLYAAFKEIADKITNLPKVEKITDQTGKVDLSSYANQTIGNVVIFKGSVNNEANCLKTYAGDKFKELLKDGQFDLAAFINSDEIKDKVTENDIINIEIVVNK